VSGLSGGFILGGAGLRAGAINGLASAFVLLVLVSAASFLLAPVSLGLTLYTPELFPTRIRAISSSMSGAWQRVAAGIGPIVVGALLPTFGLGMVFVYFGTLAILGGLLTDKIEDQLARIKKAPRLVRSFFKRPSVACITA
jgi:putative MFS transporter